MVGNDVRPLGFQPGIRAIVRQKGQVRVVPVAFRFEFWQEERPEAFVRFGRPVEVSKADRKDLVPRLEQALTDELDALKVDVTAQDAGRFSILMSGGSSISDRYARVRAFFFGKTPGAPEFDDSRVEA